MEVTINLPRSPEPNLSFVIIIIILIQAIMIMMNIEQ